MHDNLRLLTPPRLSDDLRLVIVSQLVVDDHYDKRWEDCVRHHYRNDYRQVTIHQSDKSYTSGWVNLQCLV